MNPRSCAELAPAAKKGVPRRARFLAKRAGGMPGSALARRRAPFYPQAGRGRGPDSLGGLLRVPGVQLFANRRAPGMAALRYEVAAGRRGAGGRPAETTILKFRHFWARPGLGAGLFAQHTAQLQAQGQAQGHGLKRGRIVDASINDAPRSTKNQAGEREPEMHQTKKGKHGFFGMKAPSRVDSAAGLTPSLATTPANGADVSNAHLLLHGGEEEVLAAPPAAQYSPRHELQLPVGPSRRDRSRSQSLSRLLGPCYRRACRWQPRRCHHHDGL